MPVMLEFRHLLLDPRRIYELTRSGYGLNYFLSTALCYLAVVLSLFRSRMGTVERIVFLVACLLFLWLHGSKGHMLTVLSIVMLYAVYVRDRKVGILGLFTFGIAMALIGILLFMLTNPQILTQGADGVVRYSTYSQNGMLVIDSGIGPYLGKITLEDELFSRLPRVLFPDKPNDFGQFFLAQHFFPDEFAAGQGAPAFGYGGLFADFGVTTIVIAPVLGFLNGALLRLFVNTLRRQRGAGEFILFIFAAGIPLIPSATFLLPETALLAIIANGIHALRLRPATRTH